MEQMRADRNILTEFPDPVFSHVYNTCLSAFFITDRF